MKTHIAVGFASLVSVVTISCGGDGGGGGGSCGQVAGCGGNVVANWQVAEVCGNDAPMAPPSCPAATIDTSGIKFGGNFNAKADMTYTSTLSLSGSMKMTLPGTCLMAGPVTLTCADLTAALQGDAMEPDSTFQSASCVAAGTGCACTMVMKPDSTSETGTYSTSGSVLTLVDQDGPEMSDYCVKGNNLHLRESMPMPMGMTMNVGIVLKK